ncbi:helix-turn-helix domain-containing protein [Cellvibrio sp.]|uniref:helix-turn-helix domain-containing protein n=1 Tax=Cellvibrio sp. TaxID=1965322 RepID=UPI003964790B
MVDEGIDSGSAVENAQPKKESPGEMLLQARIKAGLTQEQVAKDLYMTVYKVKALETDDYKRLNSDTFARGYIRAYANLVKLDVVAVLAAYDKLMEELRPQPVVLQKAASQKEPGHRGAWHFLAIIAAFFLGLWIISVWFFDNHSDTQYVVASDRISSLPMSEKAKIVLPAPASAVASSSSNLGVSSIAMSEAATTEATSSSAASSAASSLETNATISAESASSLVEQSSSLSSKKAGLDELNLSFRAESWIEVSDSRGDVLATELQSAGSKLKLVGMAPFDVKLGNAPAVDVQLNGKKIEVIPLMGSNVLIMRIGN